MGLELGITFRSENTHALSLEAVLVLLVLFARARQEGRRQLRDEVVGKLRVPFCSRYNKNNNTIQQFLNAHRKRKTITTETLMRRGETKQKEFQCSIYLRILPDTLKRP